jgi:ribonuclease VapC
MILDTSAIIAILFNEDDAEIFSQAITRADSRRLSAATFVETAIIVDVQTRPPTRRVHSPGRNSD